MPALLYVYTAPDFAFAAEICVVFEELPICKHVRDEIFIGHGTQRNSMDDLIWLLAVQIMRPHQLLCGAGTVDKKGSVLYFHGDHAFYL